MTAGKGAPGTLASLCVRSLSCRGDTSCERWFPSLNQNAMSWRLMNPIQQDGFTCLLLECLGWNSVWVSALTFKALKVFSVPALQQDAGVSGSWGGSGWMCGQERKFWYQLFAEVTSRSAELWAGLDTVCTQLCLRECSAGRFLDPLLYEGEFASQIPACFSNQ